MLTWLAIKFIFFPDKLVSLYPQEWDLKFEEVFVESTDGLKLHGWFFPGGPPNRTLIFYHGNAGNIGDRLPKIKLLHGLGMNVFIFDYRGYGGSEGSPSLNGVVGDSIAAYEYVLSRSDIDPNHIILYGESLGGAMAVQVAAKKKYAALILDSTFTSIKDMAKSAYSIISGLAPDVYRSIDLIKELHEPLLIMHGKEDNVVPYHMGKILYEAAPHPKRMVTFEGTEHGGIHADAEKYIESLDKFLSEIGQ